MTPSLNTMRAVVTGGAGFIGSAIADALVDGGAEVLVIDDLSQGTRANLESVLNRGARLIELDVRDGGAAWAPAHPEIRTAKRLISRAAAGRGIRGTSLVKG